jgi:hypothetical protein
MITLPIYSDVEDIQAICGYLSTKPMGASLNEMKAVVQEKHLDSRKITALKVWALIEEGGRGLKVTDLGRAATKNDGRGLTETLVHVIKNAPPYLSIIERAAHRNEIALTSVDIAAHWHDHFEDHVASNERMLNEQVVCFLKIAEGAGLGTLTIGRRGSPTRFEFNQSALAAFLDKSSTYSVSQADGIVHEVSPVDMPIHEPTFEEPPNTQLGQAIFIAHGKNKKPLEQLKTILDQFKIPYKVAVDEPNLGRPISSKVRETMELCNCAILIFTADEEFQGKDGKAVWRPNENVVYELGASGFLYDNKIVIMKEESVEFPTNFRDLGYISFTKDQLDNKAMDILKELIGFGIVKVTT